MRRARIHYEPVFGAVVCIVGAALLCFAVIVKKNTGASLHGTLFCGASAMLWGTSEIVGYRQAKAAGVPVSTPTLGVALCCAFFGLMLALVAFILYEAAPDKTSYGVLIGGASVILLAVGVPVGIRQGVWRNDA